MSRKRQSILLEQPPAEIIRGAQIMAEYLPQKVAQFRDNPLIESIPPVMNPNEVTEYLLQLPPYSDKDQEMDLADRVLMTETAREFFVPNGKHLTVYYAIINMIRRGYVRRNPVMWGFWNQLHQNIESFLNAIKEKPFPNSRARGLALVGSGGTGKSTTVEKILQSLPQVIIHVSYKDQVFIMKQLVWLKLDCPHKGSLKQLCEKVFEAVDEILGTTYKKFYAGSTKHTLDTMISGIARVVANHCLGVIVIDEIQDISEARSGGDISMVNFFVHLENAIGVPFAFIGTQDAEPLLQGQFRQLRRVCEQGYIRWNQMSEVEPEIKGFDEDDDDDELVADKPVQSGGDLASSGEEYSEKKTLRPDPVWRNFVETLWTYQYVKQKRDLKENVVEDKCAHTLYRFSKGNPAVAQTIFVLTQQLAILNREEKITPRLIRVTVQANLEEITEMLGEARMKKPREIRPVGDLADMDDIYEAEIETDNFHDEANGQNPVNESVPEAGGTEDVATKSWSKTEKATAKPKVARSMISPGSKVNKSGKASGRKPAKLPESDLPSPTNKSSERPKRKGASKTDKFSRSPAEYLNSK